MAVASETCVIEIPGMPRELLALLDERARLMGVTRDEYIRRILERHLNAADLDAPARLREILAPVHEQTEASGATEEEIAEFFEEMRDRVWQEKGRQRAILTQPKCA